MSKKQLVTFSPMDPFFFGGESTFGKGEQRNFFAASNYFPQQTTLVGVLRHVLHEAEHTANMGNSFVVKENDATTSDFGYLETVSPVFVCYQEGDKMVYGLPIRLPLAKAEQATKPIAYKCAISESEKVDFGAGWQPAAIIEQFTEKHGFEEYLLFSNGDLKTYDEVFLPVHKIGIARVPIKHTTEEGMFYNQVLYQFKSGYSFAALVSGTTELFAAIQNRNMPMGGEQVNFVLKTKTEDRDFDTLFNTTALAAKMDTAREAIFLAADTYVSSDIYAHCHLAITTTKSFRNIVTPTKEYTASLSRSKSKTERYKSEKFTLISRGSILFPNGETTKITKALDHKAFQQIGYNHYFIHSKKQA